MTQLVTVIDARRMLLRELRPADRTAVLLPLQQPIDASPTSSAGLLLRSLLALLGQDRLQHQKLATEAPIGEHLASLVLLREALAADATEPSRDDANPSLKGVKSLVR